MKIVIARHGEEEKFVELPMSPDDQEAEELIEAAAHAICIESVNIKNARRSGDPAQDPWAEWVRPVCYRFIEHCIAQSLEDHLNKRLARYRRYTDSEDIFSRYLLAIFAEDAVNFTESDRYRLSWELWYAYRHYVPWQFLNGFIINLKNFSKQKALNRIEAGFSDWIALHRSANPDVSSRGIYPKAIEELSRNRAIEFLEFFRAAKRDDDGDGADDDVDDEDDD